MFLIRLVYASKATSNLSSQDIEHILESARKTNQATAVTGILTFNHNYFLQCLEGSRDAVNDTYHRILNDPRHEQPRLLAYEQIDSRLFSRWSMAYIPSTKITKEMNLAHGPTELFEPYQLSGKGALMLLEDLAGELKSV